MVLILSISHLVNSAHPLWVAGNTHLHAVAVTLFIGLNITSMFMLIVFLGLRSLFRTVFLKLNA